MNISQTSPIQLAERSPRIPRRKPLTANVGVFGVGHYAYWPQFEGLLEEMHRKLAIFVSKVRANDVSVVDFGIVDDARSAYLLRDRMKAASLDLIFCDMVTYATSATFGAIIRDLDVPIVLGSAAAHESDGLHASVHLHAALQRRFLFGARVYRGRDSHG